MLGATAGLLMMGAVPQALAADKDDPPYVYGPAPDWVKYKHMGEAAIRGLLVNPDAARFEWPYGYRQSSWKPGFKARRHGYTSCGYVSHFGKDGDAGQAAFVVVIDHDRVVYADLGKSSGNSFIDRICDYLMHQGAFPLARTMSAAAPPKIVTALTLPAMSRMGLTFLPVAHGAYIESLQPDSAAERAGLKPGMVISHVNGVALAGMGEAMPRVLEAVEGMVSLNVVGGASFILQPSPTTLHPAPAKAVGQ
jgi:hypothetical protein